MNIPEDKLSKIADLQTKRTRAYSDDNSLSPDDIRDRIQDIAQDAGYTRLGSGDYRIVYGSGNHVVKIAWNKLGQKENKAEFDNWRRIKNIPVDRISGDERVKARRYLAEVYEDYYDDLSFNWIVMEKVRTGSNNVTNEEARKIRESFSDAGISIAEIKPYNIGVKSHEDIDEEVPAVFDYGGK